MNFTIFKGQNGQWYWHLQGSNNRIIAAGGEGFHHKEDCLRSIELVMAADRSTPIYER